MPLRCCCDAAAMLLQCCCDAAAMLWQCCCDAAAMLLRCCCDAAGSMAAWQHDSTAACSMVVGRHCRLAARQHGSMAGRQRCIAASRQHCSSVQHRDPFECCLVQCYVKIRDPPASMYGVCYSVLVMVIFSLNNWMCTRQCY